MKAPLKNLFLLFITILLASCAGTPKISGTDMPEGEYLFLNRDYKQAARVFQDNSRHASNEDRALFLLRAAAAYAYTDQSLRAQQIIVNLKAAPADALFNDLLKLSLAHIAINDRRAEDVLQILNQPFTGQTPYYYKAEFHELRATAFNMLGQRLETAQELTRREAFLREQAHIVTNQHRIWTALGMLSERSLKQMKSAPPPDVMSGWMELVTLSKQYQLNPQRLQTAIQEWQQRYPAHPVHGEILNTLLNRKIEDVQIPKKLAILLPLEGRISAAARAIRDGLLAAYYSRDKSTNPGLTLKIYNTQGTVEGAQQAYQQAMADGAGFVIGPLNKDAVMWLSQNDALQVPTLALNYLTDLDSIPANLFQFGLLPEEEAKQVAERAWLDGHVNAAVFTPEGAWGERIYQAFKQRWEEVGGRIVEQQSYAVRGHNFSAPIQALLNIDESQRRFQSLTALLGERPKFVTRRREDIDFIFLAADPIQGRQIRPLLKFYHATRVPVYATSHLYSGNLTPEKDRDMDGIRFGDMPWVLSESTSHRGLRAEIESLITDAGNHFQRMYALGVDAFNVIPALNTLKNYSYERFQGETGSLSLDAKQRIRRQLTWVYFRSGRPALLEQAGMQ